MRFEKEDKHIAKLYEGYNSTGDQTNFPSGITTDTKNSYTSSINNPGQGPVNPTGGNPSTGDIFEFPSMKDLTSEQLVHLFKKQIKKEIELAEEKGMNYALRRFKRLYSSLLELSTPEDDEA